MQLASRPLALSQDLRQPDRRALDDAVFELLGVRSAAERGRLTDRLYTETAAHFRAIRVTEIQKMEDRSEASGGSQGSMDLLGLVELRYETAGTKAPAK